MGHLLGNVNIADSTALKAPLIASIRRASETVISVLGVLDGVENVWSLKLHFCSCFVVRFYDERIYINVLEALCLTALTHLSLLHHRLL